MVYMYVHQEARCDTSILSMLVQFHLFLIFV